MIVQKMYKFCIGRVNNLNERACKGSDEGEMNGWLVGLEGWGFSLYHSYLSNNKLIHSVYKKLPSSQDSYKKLTSCQTRFFGAKCLQKLLKSTIWQQSCQIGNLDKNVKKRKCKTKGRLLLLYLQYCTANKYLYFLYQFFFKYSHFADISMKIDGKISIFIQKFAEICGKAKSCGNSRKSQKLRKFAEKSKVAAKIAAANS